METPATPVEVQPEQTNQFVQIVKVSEENPRTQENLITGYEVKGYLLTTPKEGSSLILDRRSRNGIQVPGLFQTSPIKTILEESSTEFLIKTENSTYRMILIKD